MRTITTEIVVDAQPSQVWEVLVDRDAYRTWNPFIRRMDGELVVGERLSVEIGPPGSKSMTFRPTVTAVEPDRRLAWLGRLVVRGVFDGHHSFELQPLEDDRTRFVHSERFSGLLVAMSGRMLDHIADGFDQFNLALKERVERQLRSSAGDGARS